MKERFKDILLVALILSAPYKGELNPKDPPHTCDTCRRYGKSDHNCHYCRHEKRPDLWETKEKAHE